ncbi:hypothetical protein [Paramuribaculum intestinale]|uniref:hypothetical protein n=1 Tax=Paramuribaculum intestinale TaxID=2094151 RepID=UPI0025B5DC15|nr:hypothetical protein [Paramuribaculum intestinale]
MSTKRLQRVKVSATGVERGGGRVKQCVNLVRLRGALMRDREHTVNPVCSLPYKMKNAPQVCCLATRLRSLLSL